MPHEWINLNENKRYANLQNKVSEKGEHRSKTIPTFIYNPDYVYTTTIAKLFTTQLKYKPLWFYSTWFVRPILVFLLLLYVWRRVAVWNISVAACQASSSVHFCIYGYLVRHLISFVCVLCYAFCNRPKAKDFFFSIKQHDTSDDIRKERNKSKQLAHLRCLQLRIVISHKDGRQKQPWFVPHLCNQLVIRRLNGAHSATIWKTVSASRAWSLCCDSSKPEFFHHEGHCTFSENIFLAMDWIAFNWWALMRAVQRLLFLEGCSSICMSGTLTVTHRILGNILLCAPA